MVYINLKGVLCIMFCLINYKFYRSENILLCLLSIFEIEFYFIMINKKEYKINLILRSGRVVL